MECYRCQDQRVEILECVCCGKRNRGCVIFRRGLFGEMARVCCRCWANVPPADWHQKQGHRVCFCFGQPEAKKPYVATFVVDSWPSPILSCSKGGHRLPETWDGRPCQECAARNEAIHRVRRR